jgi:hypothetical protein
MNYERIYNSIIYHRIQNPLPNEVYGEKHHIIPKSLGGDDNITNIVKLSAREHFICHALLAEMYEKYSNEWYKMNHAFMMMKACATGNRYLNAKLYELKRIDFSLTMSYNQSGQRNSQFGISKSQETKNKISNTLRIRYNTNEKLKQKEIDTELYTFNGVYFNLYRRRTLAKIFKVTLDNFNNDMLLIINTLNDLYINKSMSTNDIAKLYETNNETIRNYLKLFKIDRRSLSDSIKLYVRSSA